jgi:hypothetical protein
MKARYPTILATVRSVVVLCVIVAAGARPAAAEERPAPSVEFPAGAFLFADDGIVREAFIGGAVRFYVLPRVSVGPELVYVQGRHHSHLVLTGNVTFDFLAPAQGRPRLMTPYAVAGGGLFQTRERFPGAGAFTSTEGAFTAGLGVRALAGRRITIGAEARIGWELHLRLNGTVGVRLGR